MKRYVFCTTDEKFLELNIEVFLIPESENIAASELLPYDKSRKFVNILDESTRIVDQQAVEDWKCFICNIETMMDELGFKRIETESSDKSLDSRYITFFALKKNRKLKVRILYNLRVSQHYEHGFHNREADKEKYIHREDVLEVTKGNIPSWKIESILVNGRDSHCTTYGDAEDYVERKLKRFIKD